MNRVQIFFISMLALCITPVAAGAEGNIHVGQLKINPYISLNEAYSDNIFYTSSDKRNDVITTTTPGVRFQYPFGMHEADLEYYSVFSRYHRYSSENTNDDHANGKVNLNFGSLVSLNLSDAEINGHEPRSSSSTGFVEIYRTNTAAASATYQLAELSKIQLDYSKTLWHFKTSGFRNRDEGLVSGYFYYRFLPKTSAFIEYDLKNVVFSQSTPTFDVDNKVASFLAGLTWEISKRSKGTVKVGATKKEFKSGAGGDFSGWTAYADVHHDLTENTSILLNGQRTVNETTLIGDRYFITTGASAELTHRLLRRLSGVVRSSYGQDDYSDPIPPDTTTRKDRTLLAGAGLKYVMKDWLEFAVDYNHTERRSNIAVNDYNENSYILMANISL